MLESTLYNVLLIGLLVLAPIVLVALLIFSAPYGRHRREGWGPEVSARAAWLIMETPAVLGFALFFFLGPRRFEPVPLILFALWQLHYVDRTFLYPMRIRPSGRPTALVVALSGMSFQLLNGYLNGTWLSSEAAGYELSWLMDPRFLAGAALFVAGYVINRWADKVLLNLRKPGETGYKIPKGGLYELITCPNYFGEMLIWGGFALATWSLAGLSFLLFTVANLLPRALSNHKWYKEKFEDYPEKRRALIPFIL